MKPETEIKAKTPRTITNDSGHVTQWACVTRYLVCKHGHDVGVRGTTLGSERI